jgi:hypothetical protein
MRNTVPILAIQATGGLPWGRSKGLEHPFSSTCFRSSGRMLLLAALLAVPCGTSSQQQSQGMGGHFPAVSHDPSSDANQLSPFYDPNSSAESEKRLRMINAERQKTMIADTDKLVKLAKELNEEIAKSNTGELSAAQLRKVAEIEKLAHNVRDKMVMSVRGPQFNNMDNTPPFFSSPVH